MITSNLKVLWPISGLCSISIPPEKVKKCIEMDYGTDTGRQNESSYKIIYDEISLCFLLEYCFLRDIFV